jgi:hypothetical protein
MTNDKRLKEIQDELKELKNRMNTLEKAAKTKFKSLNELEDKNIAASIRLNIGKK